MRNSPCSIVTSRSSMSGARNVRASSMSAASSGARNVVISDRIFSRRRRAPARLVPRALGGPPRTLFSLHLALRRVDPRPRGEAVDRRGWGLGAVHLIGRVPLRPLGLCGYPKNRGEVAGLVPAVTGVAHEL